MVETSRKCAHPSCTCTAGKDSKYCSQYCSDAAGTLEIACNCGHPGCMSATHRSHWRGGPAPSQGSGAGVPKRTEPVEEEKTASARENAPYVCENGCR